MTKGLRPFCCIEKTISSCFIHVNNDSKDSVFRIIYHNINTKMISIIKY